MIDNNNQLFFCETNLNNHLTLNLVTMKTDSFIHKLYYISAPIAALVAVATLFYALGSKKADEFTQIAKECKKDIKLLQNVKDQKDSLIILLSEKDGLLRDCDDLKNALKDTIDTNSILRDSLKTLVTVNDSLSGRNRILLDESTQVNLNQKRVTLNVGKSYSLINNLLMVNLDSLNRNTVFLKVNGKDSLINVSGFLDLKVSAHLVNLRLNEINERKQKARFTYSVTSLNDADSNFFN